MPQQSSDVDTSSTKTVAASRTVFQPRGFGWARCCETQMKPFPLLRAARESRFFHRPYRLLSSRSRSHSISSSRSSLQSISSHLWVSFFIFITCFTSLCSGIFLPFGANPTPSATGSGIDGINREVVTFERFTNVYIDRLTDGDNLQYIPENTQSEHYVISELFSTNVSFPRFYCNATLANPFGSNESLPVSWIDSISGAILSPNDTLIFETPPIDKVKVRCKADIVGIEGLIDGSVISRSLTLSVESFVPLVVQPLRTTTQRHQPLRLECFWSPELTSSITWHEANGAPIDAINYVVLPGRSILHLRSMKTSMNVTCASNGVHSKPAFIEVLDETDAPIVNRVTPPSETVTAAVNSTVVFECLASSNLTIQWFYTPLKLNSQNLSMAYIQKQLTLSTTLLIFENLTPEFSGNFKCVGTDDGDTVFTLQYRLSVVDKRLDPVSKTLNEINRKQGTPLTARCQTYPHLGENPQNAKWFFNGAPFVRSPYQKIVTSTQNNVGYSDMLVAIAEAPNQGIYTCVVEGTAPTERIQQYIARVDVTTNETIKNVRIDVNHKTRCLALSFAIPPSSDYQFAQFTTYFVIVFDPHDPDASLNSLPHSATCNTRLRCKIKICADSSEMLEPAKEYAFRVSTVLGGTGAIITPMSPVILATTWDGDALRSLPVDWMITAEGHIRVHWDAANNQQVKGVVDHYMVQLANYSDKMTNLLGSAEGTFEFVDPEANEFIIHNITMPFAYKIRVVPITRTMEKSFERMRYIEYFPFFLLSSDDEVGLEKLPLPVFTLEQPDKKAAILIQWHYDEPSPAKFILFRYQQLLSTQVDPVPVFLPSNIRTVNVGNRIEAGYVYQVCAAYKSNELTSHGPWKCDSIAVKDANDKLVFSTIGDAIKRKQLPVPITCANGQRCDCMPSKKYLGGIRIEWDPPKSDAQTLFYTVHYTFNETDLTGKEVAQPANNETFVDLPPLVPGATYRIMISTSNEHGDTVNGAFFSCITPSDGALPPPKNFGYTILNVSHVELHWTPLALGDNTHLIDGYTIFWHADGDPISGTFVEGAKTRNYIIGDLQFQSLYSAYIVSHSPISGTSSLKANELFIRVPTIPTSVTPYVIWYERPHMRSLLLVMAAMSISVLIVLITVTLCVMWVCLPLWDWHKKQVPNLILQRANSNASSALTINSETQNEMVALAEEAVESCPLLNFPGPSPDDPVACCDSKGPAGGPRPLGNRRFRQCTNDPVFQARIAELNQDPTGLGLPAGMRDMIYIQMQREHTRKFQEIVDYQRRELDKRKRFGRRSHGDANVVETTFINGAFGGENFTKNYKATPPASIHGDTRVSESEGLLAVAKRKLMSHSLTELRKPSIGLSPRSNSIAFVKRFFPGKRSTVVLEAPEVVPMVELATSSPQSPASSVNGVPGGAPASSLPNLTDSGIVFDEHNSSATSSASAAPLIPRVRQASASGSLTITTDDQPSDLLRLHDCRQQTDPMNLANVVATTVMP